MERAYLGMGSNIEPRYQFLREAVNIIKNKNDIRITDKSSIYETRPVGYLDQEDFLNAVLEIETILKPLQLLKLLQSIEKQLGRKKTIRWGPRNIDLDILLYDDTIIKTKELQIPHPRMHERAFVMLPLLEIAPDIKVKGETVKSLVKCMDIDEQAIKKVSVFS